MSSVTGQVTRMETRKTRAVQVSRAGGPFETVDKELPEPSAHQVRVRVEACGVCHSDMFVKEGWGGSVQYPRVPGHEVAGVIDKVGPDVTDWKPGQRVGVGWYGGRDGYCESCRRGDFINCQNLKVTGLSFDGGYEQYMVAPAEALAAIPPDLSAVEAAPLMCAGITTYNSLRNSGARPGDLVAILGVGGLGHLGVQFAAKMGFNTMAIARGRDKEPMARKLGANNYVDSVSMNPAEELAKLGGARVILATAVNGPAITATMGGLAPNGKLVLLAAAPEPLQIPAGLLISGRRSIAGWASGTSKDSEETLKFAAMNGIRPVAEVYPLDKAGEAYQSMITGKARFRAVLQIAQ